MQPGVSQDEAARIFDHKACARPALSGFKTHRETIGWRSFVSREPGMIYRPIRGLGSAALSFSALCVFVAAMVYAPPVRAASFDCARARGADERAICANRTLNDKDVTMALLLEVDRRFLTMGRRGVIDDEQAHWLKGRRACGAELQCLTSAYDHRIGALQAILEELYTHGPF